MKKSISLLLSLVAFATLLTFTISSRALAQEGGGEAAIDWRPHVGAYVGIYGDQSGSVYQIKKIAKKTGDSRGREILIVDRDGIESIVWSGSVYRASNPDADNSSFN